MKIARNVLRILRVLSVPAIVWLAYVLRAGRWVRFYPVLMVAIAFSLFALSLRKTPLVETFARKMGATLDAHGLRYCRNVTRLWAVFLAAHLVVTLLTVFASHEVWAFYNGLIAYVLMGTLLAGEWLYRQRMQCHG